MNINQKQQLLKVGSLILNRAALERKVNVLNQKIHESRRKQEKIQSFLIQQGISEQEMKAFLLQNGLEV